VIRGQGAFVEVARTQDDFPRAIRRKLEKELTEQLIGRAGDGWSLLRVARRGRAAPSQPTIFQ